MKLYEIEAKEDVVNTNGLLEIIYKYRFFSLYNGTRGTWYYKKENAEKQGEKHQEIIGAIHYDV